MTADLRWTLSGGVRLAFSSAVDGDMRDPVRRGSFLTAIGCADRCVVPTQIHGAAVVGSGDRAALATADGVATRLPGPAVAVFGADCPGLCIAAADALAVAHCGWRGTAAGIVASAVSALSRLTALAPTTWQAFIGPGISAAHYEVDGPVLNARKWPDAALRDRRGDRARLDLVMTIADDLLAHGIGDLKRADVCTWDDARLWSYRRRGAGIVQALVAWRDEASPRSGTRA